MRVKRADGIGPRPRTRTLQGDAAPPRISSGASVSCRERRLSLKRCEKDSGGVTTFSNPTRAGPSLYGRRSPPSLSERRQQPAMGGIQLPSVEGVGNASSGGGIQALTSSQAPSPAEALEGSFLSLPRSSVSLAEGAVRVVRAVTCSQRSSFLTNDRPTPSPRGIPLP